MDNATFDRLARLLAGGASRRHTLRAIIAAALAGGTAGTADELLAARKNRNKNDRDKKKDDDKDRKDRDRDGNQGGGDGNANRAAAQGKKSNTRKKRKKKKKKNPNGGNTGGNRCAGTPLQPGQMFLGCDFSGRNLRGEDLNSSSFKDVDLTDADLCGANLESTSFTDSEADDANFTDVNFDSSSHDNTSYAGANFTNATFRVSTFNEVDFTGADFTGANFTGATFSDTDFSGAIFCRTTQPNGNEDNRDCDICDNTCGLCDDCADEDCTPPDCCPNPGPGSRGICVDTDTDPLNCGGCDRACFTNLADACVDGRCVCGDEPQCSGDDTCCPGQEGDEASCIDLDNDINNCGACGRLCLSSTNPCITVDCVAGACVDVPADDGTACRRQGQDGVCCAAGSTVTCVVGTVCCSAAQCDAGEACCEGQCIDVQDDPNNCGGCNEICVFPENPCFGSECVGGDCQSFNLPDGTVCVFGEADGVCCSGSCAFGFECCSDAQCGAGQSCCGGLCANTSDNFNRCGSCTTGCDAAKATACVGSTCVCGSVPACTGNQSCCPGEGGDPAACVNTNNDTLNCGSCEAACLISTNPCLATVCENGQCKDIPVENGSACAVGEQGGICCASGQTSTCIVGGECCTSAVCEATEACCENQCIDIQEDFNNCGACDNSCADSVAECFHRECNQGECQTVPDEDGEPCFQGEEGICCADGSTAICVGGGQCCTDAECFEAGDGCCDNQCIDVQGDFENCGSCANLCDSTKANACEAGECVCGTGSACAPDLSCCASTCVDIAADFNNCGFCGDICFQTADTCSAGECVCGALGFACSEGNVCCEGACVDTGNNVNNCGSCGNTCTTRANDCSNGACVCGANPQCAESETCCSNACIDTGRDRFNCGSCGFECVGGVCNNGSCVSCEGGIPCGSECLVDGENVCCVSEDCERTRFCEVVVGCSEEHICLFANEDNGTFCGCGGECQEGVCVGQGEC